MMPDDPRPLTVSVENYLKAIHHLQEETTGRVKTKAIAELLGISLPSVTAMLKALAESELVDHQPYQGAVLTEQGRRLALRVIRNHRLIEVFLVETLGYTWDEVHHEAERLEHAISDELADRIDRYLGHPRFDPHGDPIPTAGGEVSVRAERSLVEAPRDTDLVIARVLDQSPEVLRYIGDLGLVPSATVRVIDVLPFDGPVQVRCRGREVPLSRALASRLLVAPIDAPTG